MFTAAEAMGLVMAVLEGHRKAADPADPVGSALAKIVRVLPERVAGPVRTFREVTAPGPAQGTGVSPELTATLIEACTAARRVRLRYRLGHDVKRVMEIDPWAVVLRHSLWYLLGWSHTRQAQRVLRVDRIVTAETTLDTFAPPPDLDALRTLEEHFWHGWTYPVDVLIDATPEQAARWLPRSLGRLDQHGPGQTRLCATTDELDWYARQLATIPAPFRVLGSPELQRATAALGQRLAESSGSGPAQ
jgi:predicted DNA-binding transcriptional regulator YafY